MKKIISAVVLLAMLINISLPCYAANIDNKIPNDIVSYSNNVMAECAIIAQSQIDRYNNSQTIIGVSEVYNTAGELIAYCYNFEPDGYVIVTIDDYVPQVVAPAHETPYPHDTIASGMKYVYGGGLNFWTIGTNGVLTDIETGMQSTVSSEIVPFRVAGSAEARQTNLSAVLNAGQIRSANSVNVSTDTMITTSHIPEAFGNQSYLCGPKAASIVLYYLYCYRGLYIPSYVFSYYGSPCQGITEYLLNNGYLIGRNSTGDAGMSAFNMVNGLLFSYTGLDDFLTDIGASSSVRMIWINANSLSDSISQIKQSILLDYPAIVSTSSTPQSSLIPDHFYVVYGYIDYLTFTRFIVNDVNGNLGIELNAITMNLYDAVLFS